MVSALLILMIGFVAGVALTVALGLGLYKLLARRDVEGDASTEVRPTQAPTAHGLSPTQGPDAGGSSYPIAAPQVKQATGFPWEPRWPSPGSEDWRP